ncbi:hypothetical protein PRIPAC_82941 [Pristionchus pacificus]|uniref:G protein-coupled receptor n=1 Tax=Pristionchus pacificus TaxID=54126 RepID=A0A2A6CMB2_PRIPA|nr:hypothetical protein PRIPAC_82941 [Pristionchus pacificus]|eukprot:PDM79238.1 G protein-coupled receptor [Pristionchus pacificus]
MTLPSDMIVRPICIIIGIVSFCVNTFTLFLIVKHRKIYSTNIFNVFIILQTLYLIQNFHFSILFIPFLYSTLGGGYCIGILCEQHRVPFHINYVSRVDLPYCSSLWILHSSSLLSSSESFRCIVFFETAFTNEPMLEREQAQLFSISLLFYMSIPAFRYAFIIYRQDSRDSEKLLRTLCSDCHFIGEGRNFGVIDRDDSIISGVLILVITASCATFAFLCGGHIMHLANKYRNRIRSSSTRTSVNLRQTMLSLIQIIVFGAFLAVPIGSTVSMLWIGHHDCACKQL